MPLSCHNSRHKGCVDFLPLNIIKQTLAHFLLLIFWHSSQAMYLTSLDLKSGYWQTLIRKCFVLHSSHNLVSFML